MQRLPIKFRVYSDDERGRRLLAARRDAGVTVTPDQTGRVVLPEHGNHVTFDQFKAVMFR